MKGKSNYYQLVKRMKIAKILIPPGWELHRRWRARLHFLFLCSSNLL